MSDVSSSNGKGHSRQPGARKHTPVLLQRVVTLYQRGVPFREIGRECGISGQTARRWAVEAGYHPPPTRARGSIVRVCDRCDRRQAELKRVRAALHYWKGKASNGRPQTVLAALALLDPQDLRELARSLLGGPRTARAKRAGATRLDELGEPWRRTLG